MTRTASGRRGHEASRRRNRWVGALAAALIAGCGIVPTRAQDVDCATLAAQRDTLASASRGDAQWAAALRRQQAEIDRTRSYADSLGCGEGLLSSMFGGPRCAAVADRLARMEANRDRMSARAAAQGDDDAQLAAVSERLARFCGAMPNAPPVVAGDQGGDGARVLPVDPDGQAVGAGAGGEDAPSVAPPGRALCVRRCDGGFFPIADRVAPDRFEGLGQLCKALCPNTEAELYTTSDPSGDLATAVSVDGGAPYTALPAAFQYLKTYDATCSCKPPNQSWAEALAAAESLLQADKHDVTVTQKLSDAMARPTAAGGPAVDRAAGPAEPRAKPRRRARDTVGPPRTVRASPVPDFGQDF